MFGISYWLLPIFAACVWLGTLLAMLGTWIVEGSPHYPSMSSSQRIAYISDIGAQGLKPLFIAGSAVTVVVFDVVFITERWLRHKGRLAKNTGKFEKACSVIAVIGSIVGAAGLIFLSIFDTLRHPKTHDKLLVVFIVGYVVSAIFICAEYQRLGIHYREYRILRASFWIKLAFIIVEVALAIAFGVMTVKENYNPGAILEWIIALIYIIYVASFALDLIPAVRTKHNRFPGIDEIETGQVNGQSYNNGGGVHTNGEVASYSSSQPMTETTNGRYYQPPPGPVAPSRNF